MIFYKVSIFAATRKYIDGEFVERDEEHFFANESNANACFDQATAKYKEKGEGELEYDSNGKDFFLAIELNEWDEWFFSVRLTKKETED